MGKGESRTFINNDLNLRDLDYLCIADTGLDKTTTNEFLTQELSNWKLRRRDDAEDGRKHMGLLLLQSLSSTAKHKLEILCENNRSRLLNEITTSNNNQLDQVIISEKLSKSNCFTTSYLNFTSDHKVIVIRVPNQGNNFTTKFKQNVNFDKNKFTKRIEGLKRKN